MVARNDETIASYIERQNTDPKSRWRGAIPDRYGLHQPHTAAGILATGMAALAHPQSKYHGSDELRERMHMAVEHLERVQTADGNFDLLTTNFNSPADTAFLNLNTANAASLARKHGDAEVFGWLEPILENNGRGLVDGGIHTPNHRWIACASLALLHGLYPERKEYVDRVEQWLAEGIDIDSDGQYSEQSTTVYNAHVDKALCMVADRMNKPELLEPVRRNLQAMLYLLHPGHEVVTEISKRQDRNIVGTMAAYWFALRYMARKDQDGQYETLVQHLEPQRASLPQWMDFAVLQAEGPKPKPVPQDYEKPFPKSNLVHIRRGETSATLVTAGNSRIFALRRGNAVVNAVRFASAFFGKAQFVPEGGGKRGGVYRMTQELEGPYFQPFVPSKKQPWGVDQWYEMRVGREQTEVAKLRYVAEVKERRKGFDVRVVADGTDWVPLAIEVNLRAGGVIEGVEELDHTEDAYLLRDGWATYTRDGDSLRFGPGMGETTYTNVRGAQEKLSGPSVYLTMYTPVDRVLEFRWG